MFRSRKETSLTDFDNSKHQIVVTLAVIIFEVVDGLDVPGVSDVDKPVHAESVLSVNQEVDGHSRGGLNHPDLTVRT